MFERTTDLKTRGLELEREGRGSEALEAFREYLSRVEGRPEFLEEISLLVRVGDLEAEAGDHAAAIGSYERAVSLFIAAGDADAVIFAGLRLARIRPDAGFFLDYCTRLVEAGHPDAARRVLREVARRTGNTADAQELDDLEGGRVRDVTAAVARIIDRFRAGGTESASPPTVEKASPARMSLEDAIAEIRRQTGFAALPDAPAPLVTIAPPVQPSRRERGRSLAVAALVAVVLGGVAAVIALREQAGAAAMPVASAPARRATAAPVNTPAAPTVAEQSDPGDQAISPPEATPTPVAEPAVRDAAPAGSPVGVGLLATDPDRARLARLPSTQPSGPASPPPATLAPDTPRLPGGAVVTRSVAAVRGLPISRVDDAGRGHRVTQPLPEGGALELVLSPFGGTGVSSPRVASLASDSSAGSMRFHGYMVNARAPVPAQRLRELLMRLVEVPPRQ